MAGRPAAGEPGERFMRRALELARLGWGQVSPNPMVGAVIERDGVVVGEGAHRRFGDQHAEVEALRAAGTRARGATLHVTLEPCTHTGKTPPCVPAIIDAGVARVVVAVRDPNPEAGGGVERLRAAGIAVDVGTAASEAAELNAPFLHAFQSDRPWVTLKLAVSLDGAIARAGRTTSWLTGSEALKRVHHLRAGHDAVGVGMGTILADDPFLTVRNAPSPRVPPLRVVFSQGGRLPLTSRLAQHTDEAPVLVFATTPDPSYDHSLRALGVEVVAASSLAEALRQLPVRGIRSVLVEGGASLASALVHHDLVDRLIIFQAPVLLGEGALPAFASLAPSDAHRWKRISSEWVGEDHMIVLAREGR